MSDIRPWKKKPGNVPKQPKLLCNCGCKLFFMTSDGAICNVCKDVYPYADIVKLWVTPDQPKPTEPEVA